MKGYTSPSGLFLTELGITIMTYDKNPIIAPFLINSIILWDYTFRASQYEAFMTMSDEWAWYVPVLFEKL